MKNFRYLFLVTLLLIPGSNAFAGDDNGFCKDDNWSNGNKVSTNDLRETTIPATNLLTVDGKKNGGVKIGSN